MISQTSEYALRAVVFLARCEGLATVQQMAETCKVSPGYLAKVMRNLARERLVVSQRGLHGGFALARPPEKITVLEVIMAVDGFQRITECPLGIEGHEQLCPLHRKLDDTLAAIEASLSTTTIADLVTGDGVQPLLCTF
jgi:Rrf2 family protein